MIVLDAGVVTKTPRTSPGEAVIAWLTRHDAEPALPTVTIAEIACGIEKIRPDQRARRLEQGLSEWRQRFAGRIFAMTEEAALAYGAIMGEAMRPGRPMSAAGRHDRGDREGEWRQARNPQPRRFRDDRPRPRLAMGLLSCGQAPRDDARLREKRQPETCPVIDGNDAECGFWHFARRERPFSRGCA